MNLAQMVADIHVHPFECPEHLRESLERYRDYHIATGGFLRACLANDLFQAVSRADPDSLAHIKGVVNVVRSLPPECRGSYQAVDEWIGRRAA